MGFWSTVGNVAKTIGNALIGNAGNIAGSAVSGAFGIVSNKQQMKYQKELMSLQNNYNTKAAATSFDYSKKLQDYQNAYTSKMASTAHQIEVADMRKAGLNPILSATGGSGASVPGAGNASVSAQGVGLGSAPDVDYVEQSLNYLMNKATRRQMNFQNDKLNAETGTELERQQTQQAQTELYYKQIQDIENQIKNRDLATASQLEYNKKLGDASLHNAISNRTSANASAYYNYNRALGYSNSWSNSDGDDRSLGIFGINTKRGWSTNTSYSRSW